MYKCKNCGERFEKPAYSSSDTSFSVLQEVWGCPSCGADDDYWEEEDEE